MKTEPEIEELVLAGLRSEGEDVSPSHIEIPPWSECDSGDADWATHIPAYLRDCWNELPRYAKLIAYDLASRHAAFIAWQHDEALDFADQLDRD